MASKKELERKLEYARGYRDALVDTWENVIKLATKGYSSRELQIMSKTQALESRTQIEAKIEELEADAAQEDIIDTDQETVPTQRPSLRGAVNLRPGISLMVKEPKPQRCYAIFEKEIAGGRPGMCVSRSSPREIRDGWDIGKTRVVWLTTNEKLDGPLPPSALGFAGDAGDMAGTDDEYVQPSGLPMLYSIIVNFLDGNRGGAVLLEGLEYLNSHNTFKALINFFQKLNEDVKTKGSSLIVSANPAAFDPKHFSLLETEMSQIL